MSLQGPSCGLIGGGRAESWSKWSARSCHIQFALHLAGARHAASPPSQSWLAKEGPSWRLLPTSFPRSCCVMTMTRSIDGAEHFQRWPLGSGWLVGMRRTLLRLPLAALAVGFAACARDAMSSPRAISNLSSLRKPCTQLVIRRVGCEGPLYGLKRLMLRRTQSLNFRCEHQEARNLATRTVSCTVLQ